MAVIIYEPIILEGTRSNVKSQGKQKGVSRSDIFVQKLAHIRHQIQSFDKFSGTYPSKQVGTHMMNCDLAHNFLL